MNRSIDRASGHFMFWFFFSLLLLLFFGDLKRVVPFIVGPYIACASASLQAGWSHSYLLHWRFTACVEHRCGWSSGLLGLELLINR